jgi:hypothetical protein
MWTELQSALISRNWFLSLTLFPTVHDSYNPLPYYSIFLDRKRQGPANALRRKQSSLQAKSAAADWRKRKHKLSLEKTREGQQNCRSKQTKENANQKEKPPKQQNTREAD